jgi:tetratricopeptide (TPR) repeat protein
VLRELAHYDSDIVRFSYKEILGHIESDNDKTGLRILLLLKLVNQPLMIDQLTPLLNVPKHEVENRIAQLSRFQCVQNIYQNGEEKYQLNREIGNFARALSQEHWELVEELQKNIMISTNFGFEASSEELIAVKMFETYIQQDNLSEAQIFIREKLSEFKNAKLLNYHYASFLVKQRQYETAIDILENILKQGNNNEQAILLLLIEANSKLSQPKYEQMETYVISLQAWVRSNRSVLLSVASFYRDWALWMKSSPPPDLPREKHLRIEKYKEIAQKGLDIVTQAQRSVRDDKEYFIISQCRFCQWEYKKALEAIDSAITSAPSDSERAKYYQFRNVIIQEQEKYHQSQ